MQHRFMPCDVDQPLLLEPDLRDWLPQDHLAQFIEAAVSAMDLSVLLAAYERKDGRGRAGYHPEMLFRVLTYGYCLGIVSSRRMEAALITDVAFRFLASNQQPDHTTIAEFRRRHRNDFDDLFLEVLVLCREAGLLEAGTIALDGTKMKANASKRQSRSYDDLKEREEELLAIIRQRLAQAAEIDDREDEENKPPVNRVPEGLKKRPQQLEAIRQAKKRLEEEAKRRKEAAEQDIAQAKAEEREVTATERKRKQRADEVVKDPNRGRQINLVDPDSRLMKDAATGGIVQGYNAQIIVDTKTQLILAADVTSEETDRKQLLPMVQRWEENQKRMLVKAGVSADDEKVKECTLLADAGYWSEQDLKSEKLSGYRVMVPPERFSNFRQKGESRRLSSNAAKSEFAEAMRALLRSEEGRKLYLGRQGAIEPVFGQSKQGRGIRGFLTRGQEKVRGEWNLMSLAHNLLKLFRHKTAILAY